MQQSTSRLPNGGAHSTPLLEPKEVSSLSELLGSRGGYMDTSNLEQLQNELQHLHDEPEKSAILHEDSGIELQSEDDDDGVNSPPIISPTPAPKSPRRKLEPSTTPIQPQPQAPIPPLKSRRIKREPEPSTSPTTPTGTQSPISSPRSRLIKPEAPTTPTQQRPQSPHPTPKRRRRQQQQQQQQQPQPQTLASPLKRGQPQSQQSQQHRVTRASTRRIEQEQLRQLRLKRWRGYGP
ncbi:hypothetical protein FPQ18DRAFT_309175 [Pyronema domesticum]|nr:hypothetical protein FPQ18DRAFT_309175 [Pyronema domesticum]